MDPSSQLGLSTDSVEGYRIGDIQRLSAHGSAQAPELLPCGYLVGDSNTINIRLKGSHDNGGPLARHTACFREGASPGGKAGQVDLEGLTSGLTFRTESGW